MLYTVYCVADFQKVWVLAADTPGKKPDKTNKF